MKNCKATYEVHILGVSILNIGLYMKFWKMKKHLS